MCKRSDDDPLIRLLTDRYKLNILRLPRGGVGVGELLIREAKDLKCVGCIKKFFEPELEIQENEPILLPDLGGVTSAHVAAKIAATPLAYLLAALGVGGVSAIDAMLKATRDVSVIFAISGARYRSTDLIALGDELGSRILRQDNALYQPGAKYFVAHAAAEATGIKVAFSADRGKAAELALDIEQLIRAEASVAVGQEDSGYLVISRQQPVTFGLAVVQLKLQEDSLRFEAVDRLRAVRRESSKPAAVTGDAPNVLFGGINGDVFVEISNGPEPG